MDNNSRTETVRSAAESYIRQNPGPARMAMLTGKQYVAEERRRHGSLLARDMMTRTRFLLSVMDRHLLMVRPSASGVTFLFDWTRDATVSEGNALMPQEIAFF